MAYFFEDAFVPRKSSEKPRKKKNCWSNPFFTALLDGRLLMSENFRIKRS